MSEDGKFWKLYYDRQPSFSMFGCVTFILLRRLKTEQTRRGEGGEGGEASSRAAVAGRGPRRHRVLAARRLARW